jgi:hypothetical protein
MTVSQELYVSNLVKHIDKQHAEIELLRTDYSILTTDYDALRADIDKLMSERDGWLQEIELLRAALREIADHLHIALNQAEDSGILDAMDVARRALENKQ